MTVARVATAVVGVLVAKLPMLFGKQNRTDDKNWPDENGYDVPGFPCKEFGNSEPVGKVHGDLLKGWKLSSPKGCGGKPCSIKGSKLSKYKDEYLYYHTGRSTSVFCTPADGATSKNSNNVRVELREPYWKLLAKERHTLTARAKVHQIAGSKVTIGQIHGDKNMPDDENEMLKIQVEGGNKLRSSVKKNGKSINLEFGSYKLGDEIQYKAVLEGTNLAITMNGQTKEYDYGHLSSKAINKGGWTFKVGNYCDTKRAGSKEPGCLVEFAEFNTEHEQFISGKWIQFIPDPECNAAADLNCEDDLLSGASNLARCTMIFLATFFSLAA